MSEHVPVDLPGFSVLTMGGPESGGVTAPAGFRASGLAAGIKASGRPDVALVVNDGPRHDAAGVFTSNRVKAAPVLWTAQCALEGRFRAVVLNSGGANACTGPAGFADTHRTAEHVAELLGVAPIEVAVCSTGLIGERLPMTQLLSGADAAAAALSADGGLAAAEAIMTTDSVPKLAAAHADGWAVGGMAKGAGMLAPGLATMLVVLTTDAVVDAARTWTLRCARPPATTFDRIDSDGCMSTNDTVLLLASGASGVTPDPARVRRGRHATVCAALARQLIGDAEGATKDIRGRRRERRHRGRRRDRRPGGRPQQPAQVRDPRGGPQLGPHPVGCRHDRRRVRARRGRRGDQWCAASAATVPRSATAARSTCPAARSRSPSTCAWASADGDRLDQRPHGHVHPRELRLLHLTPTRAPHRSS